MRTLHRLTLLLPLALLAGCAGYQLGPTNGDTAGARTIMVVPFQNDTLEPRVGDALTAALRKQLQFDGTFKLSRRNDADIVVSGVVTEYGRRGQNFSSNDRATALDYRVNARARVIVRERATGRIVLEKEVSGYTLVRVAEDLNSVERQALPLLAEDLAKNATALLADGTW